MLAKLSSLRVHFEADHAHGASQVASVTSSEQDKSRVALGRHIVNAQRQVFLVSAAQAAFVVYAMQAVC